MTKPILYATTPESIQREGLTENVAPWEDGQRIDSGPGSFEWWYFDAHFDDPSTESGARGATAVIVFTTKPLLDRKGPLKPNIQLTITRPDGTKLAQYPIFPPDQFSAAAEACNMRIGANWTKGDLHTYQLHVALEGLAIDLTFTGLVPPWRPGAGKIYFGNSDHYFAWLPSIPFGSVEGTLTYDGQTYHVKGTGYHDHNWGNVGLNEVMDHWVWGRAHIGEYSLIFVEQVAARKYGFARIPVFMLAKGDRILLGDSEPLTLSTTDFAEHPGGHAYPQSLDFHWQAGTRKVHLQLRKPKIIEALSLLVVFPAWQRWLLGLFANPYYFRFNADLGLSIDLDDLKATEHGPALFEIMILQGKKRP